MSESVALPGRATRLAPIVGAVIAGVGVLVLHSHLQGLEQGFVAVAFVAWVYARPGPFVLAVPIVYPAQLFVLAFAYHEGLNHSVVRDLGFWVELVALGLTLRAVRNHLDRWPDALDWAAMAYLGVVGLYRLAPTWLVQVAPGPPTSSTVLDTGLRNDTLFVVLFFAARHLDLGPQFKRRFSHVILAVGAVVSILGLFEFLAPSMWNRFVVQTLGVTRYQAQVLEVPVPRPRNILVYTVTDGHRILRIGSVFVDQLQCAFFLVVVLVIGCELLLNRTRRPWLVASVTTLAVIGLVLTQTRDGFLAAGVALLLTLRPGPGRDPRRRRQLGGLLLIGLAATVMIALVSGVGTRTAATFSGTDQSTNIHTSALVDGIERLADEPMGRGIGTAGANGTRFGVSSTFTSEDQYLQIGNETGIFSLIAFLVLTALIVVELRRRGYDPADPTSRAWWAAFCGLAVAGLFLQVWLALESTAIAWTALGLELPPKKVPAKVCG